MIPKRRIDKEYCERYPVRKNKWLEVKDKDGHVGKYIDQYESLQAFCNDIWLRFRPYGGKCFLIEQGIFQIEDDNGTKLICRNEESKYFNQKAENYYLTRDRYKDLRQHYKMTNNQ